MNGVTFVSLRKRENVIENLSLAVFKKMVGLGSQWYCIVRSYNQEFKSFLLLVDLHYPPKEKFCVYPKDETLSRLFLCAPWIDLGRNLCSLPSLTFDEYHSNFVAPYP